MSLLLASCSQQSAPTSESPSATNQPETGIVAVAADTETAISKEAITQLPGASRKWVPGEVIVKFKPDTPRAKLNTALAKVSFKSTRGYASMPGLRHVKLADEVDTERAIATYRADPSVEYAEPNYIFTIDELPNDPKLNDEWSLNNTGQSGGLSDADIDAPEAWSTTTGSNDVVIAILDTGVDYLHPDLAANIFSNDVECDNDGVDDDANGYVDDCHGIDTLNNDSDPMDDNSHGTHVAGTIGAVGNNGVGIAGVAWNVKILSCKFISASGSGPLSAAITCLDYVASMKSRGVNVIATSNSWGGGPYIESLRQAIVLQRAQGTLFIAAAGNSATRHESGGFYPCDYDSPNVICVAASTHTDTMAYFSDYGRRMVHLAAPGAEILSTIPQSEYGVKSGTSMATPHVSGAAALLKAQDPSRDWIAIKNLLLSGGDVSPAGEQTISGKRLNVNGSLHCSNSRVATRLLPAEEEPTIRATGATVALRMLSIQCGAPTSAPSVTVSPTGEIITLSDNGTLDDAFPGDGLFNGKWTAPAPGTYTLSFTGGDHVEVIVDAQLEPGFPVKAQADGWGFFRGPSVHALVGNIDADPQLELIRTGLSFGPLYAWNHDGTVVPGWPPTLGAWAEFPVLGNFTGSADQLEVFSTAAHMFKVTYEGWGGWRAGWPRWDTMSQVPGAAVDINNDGIDEIFSEDSDGIGGAWMEAFSENGSYLTGWPRFSPANPVLSQLRTPAIADLDGDGQLELIGIDSNFVHVYHADGSQVSGFPLALPTIGYPAVGDVDGDGEAEIITVTRDASLNVSIRIVSASGAIERSIPTTLIDTSITAPALADLTGDGIPEIVLQADNGIGAWRGNGSVLTGWPVILSGTRRGNSSPVIGDIDGDRQPDIIVTTQNAAELKKGSLRAYSRAGVVLSQFPKSLPLGAGAVPALADIDQDGRNEIVASGSYASDSSGAVDTLWVFDMGGQPSGALEWGQFMHDAKHSGAYKTGQNLSGQAYLAVKTKGSGRVTSQPAGIDCGSDCIDLLAKGSQVTLTASGSDFRRWVGACAGQGVQCQLTINDYTATAAEFGSAQLSVSVAGTAAGAVTLSPSGITCESTCTTSFETGSTVTLTAAPVVSGSFVGWSGACSGSATTCTVRMDSALAVTATFDTRISLRVTRSDNGAGTVTSSPAGIDCGASCIEYFAPNTVVTLTAKPDDGSYFSGWWTTVPCENQTDFYICTFTMTRSTAIKASFTDPGVRYLTVALAGSGGGSVSSKPDGVDCGTVCIGGFTRGAIVELNAKPDPGSEFVGWTGACSGVSATCFVTMEASANVTANFEAKYQLLVMKDSVAQGRVWSIPGGIDCGADCAENFAPGTQVSLLAMPDPGRVFARWQGACSGTGSCTVTISGLHTVTATFAVPATVSLSVTGEGFGSVISEPNGINCGADCSKTFTQGMIVTLTPSAAAGSAFDGWSGACAGQAGACLLILDGDVSASASFRKLPPPSNSGKSGGGGGGSMGLVSLLLSAALLAARNRRRAVKLSSV